MLVAPEIEIPINHDFIMKNSIPISPAPLNELVPRMKSALPERRPQP